MGVMILDEENKKIKKYKKDNYKHVYNDNEKNRIHEKENTTKDSNVVNETKKCEDKLSSRIDSLEKENQELKKLVKRIAADFDNYKKWIEQSKKEFEKNSNRRIIEKLLVVIDNLERSLENIKEETEFTKGIGLIYSQLLSILKEEGLRQFNPINEIFDPQTCEAISFKKSNNKEDQDLKITNVFQKGYFLNDVLIRPARVEVIKKEVKENE